LDSASFNYCPFRRSPTYLSLIEKSEYFTIEYIIFWGRIGMALLSSAILSVKWSSISQIARQALQILTTIILAKTLSPSDLVWWAWRWSWSGSWTFQRPRHVVCNHPTHDLSEKLLSSIFWVNVVFGLLYSSCLFIRANGRLILQWNEIDFFAEVAFCFISYFEYRDNSAGTPGAKTRIHQIGEGGDCGDFVRRCSRNYPCFLGAGVEFGFPGALDSPCFNNCFSFFSATGARRCCLISRK